jgi:hypothetical protein
LFWLPLQSLGDMQRLGSIDFFSQCLKLAHLALHSIGRCDGILELFV